VTALLWILLTVSTAANVVLIVAAIRMRAYLRFLKDELDHDGVLRGEDAKRFVEGMKNPKPIPLEDYRRAKELYEGVMKNSSDPIKKCAS
jgi:hypothetical protein